MNPLLPSLSPPRTPSKKIDYISITTTNREGCVRSRPGSRFVFVCGWIETLFRGLWYTCTRWSNYLRTNFCWNRFHKWVWNVQLKNSIVMQIINYNVNPPQFSCACYVIKSSNKTTFYYFFLVFVLAKNHIKKNQCTLIMLRIILPMRSTVWRRIPWRTVARWRHRSICLYTLPRAWTASQQSTGP